MKWPPSSCRTIAASITCARLQDFPCSNYNLKVWRVQHASPSRGHPQVLVRCAVSAVRCGSCAWASAFGFLCLDDVRRLSATLIGGGTAWFAGLQHRNHSRLRGLLHHRVADSSDICQRRVRHFCSLAAKHCRWDHAPKREPLPRPTSHTGTILEVRKRAAVPWLFLCLLAATAADIAISGSQSTCPSALSLSRVIKQPHSVSPSNLTDPCAFSEICASSHRHIRGAHRRPLRPHCLLRRPRPRQPHLGGASSSLLLLITPRPRCLN